MEEVLTQQELAKRLKVTDRFIRRMQAVGIIKPAIKRGTFVRYNFDDTKRQLNCDGNAK